MQLSAPIRAALFALTMAVTGTGFATGVHADGGSIRFDVIKAGFVIGGSAGSGTLVFHGQMDPNTALTLTDDVTTDLVRGKSPARSSAAR